MAERTFLCAICDVPPSRPASVISVSGDPLMVSGERVWLVVYFTSSDCSSYSGRWMSERRVPKHASVICRLCNHDLKDFSKELKSRCNGCLVRSSIDVPHTFEYNRYLCHDCVTRLDAFPPVGIIPFLREHVKRKRDEAATDRRSRRKM